MTQLAPRTKRETTQKQRVGFGVLAGVGALVFGVMVYFLAFAPLPEAAVNCSPKPTVVTTADVETAVLVAPTATFTEIDLPLEVAAERFTQTLSDPALVSTLSVVIADENPRKVHDLVVEQESGEVIQDFEEKLDRAPGVVRVAVTCSLEAHADDSLVETDLLKALGTAANTFLNGESEKTIYVLANGLQTTGEINMVNDMPQSIDQAKELAKQLEKENALPNLKGATVEWFGLGSVNPVGDQSTINEQTVKVLEAFWGEAIKLSGGTLSFQAQEVGFAEPPTGYFATSAVTSLPASCLITLNEDDGVRFNPDVTTFVNQEKAQSAAEAVVEELNSKSCTGEIKVTGYVASGVDKDDYNKAEVASGKALSLARAKEFAALIKAAGWNGKITSVGGGKGEENDWNADGTFNESKGKNNRKVVISQ